MPNEHQERIDANTAGIERKNMFFARFSAGQALGRSLEPRVGMLEKPAEVIAGTGNQVQLNRHRFHD
jgi:hypothetical protein